MHRGEVWLIGLDPAVGAERQKTRPAVIVNDDAIGILPLRVIVPLSEWKDRYEIAPWLVRVDPSPENGLNTAVLILVFVSFCQFIVNNSRTKVFAPFLAKTFQE